MFMTFNSIDEQSDKEEQASEIAEMAENNYTVDFPALINRMNGFESTLDKILSMITLNQETKTPEREEETESNNPINGIESEDKEE